MSRKGCSPDNAACEGFFGRLKNEMYYHRNWLDTTLEQFMREVDSYIRWYNQHRIKLSLGGRRSDRWSNRHAWRRTGSRGASRA